MEVYVANKQQSDKFLVPEMVRPHICVKLVILIVDLI